MVRNRPLNELVDVLLVQHNSFLRALGLALQLVTQAIDVQLRVPWMRRDPVPDLRTLYGLLGRWHHLFFLLGRFLLDDRAGGVIAGHRQRRSVDIAYGVCS